VILTLINWCICVLCTTNLFLLTPVHRLYCHTHHVQLPQLDVNRPSQSNPLWSTHTVTNYVADHSCMLSILNGKISPATLCRKLPPPIKLNIYNKSSRIIWEEHITTPQGRDWTHLHHVRLVAHDTDADLYIAQQMSLPLTISCSSKSRLVLPSWFYHFGTGSPG